MASGKINYTPYEKNLLYTLVENEINIIESKKNDAKMISVKDKCWLEIQANYSSTSGVNPRTVQQLKNLWKNLKSKAKKDATSKKNEERKTGGGPPLNPVTDLESSISQKICELLPQQIFGLENEFDGDSKKGKKIIKPNIEPTDETSNNAEEEPGQEDEPLSEDIPSTSHIEKPQPIPIFPVSGTSNKGGVKLEILDLAKIEHEEKLKTLKMEQKTQNLKQEVQNLKRESCKINNEILELKKIKLQIEIGNLQGYNVALVTNANSDTTTTCDGNIDESRTAMTTSDGSIGDGCSLDLSLK